VTARVVNLGAWKLERAAKRTSDNGRSLMPLEFCKRVAENARREVLAIEASRERRITTRIAELERDAALRPRRPNPTTTQRSLVFDEKE
jgi:hypothetical protein